MVNKPLKERPYKNGKRVVPKKALEICLNSIPDWFENAQGKDAEEVVSSNIPLRELARMTDRAAYTRCQAFETIDRIIFPTHATKYYWTFKNPVEREKLKQELING